MTRAALSLVLLAVAACDTSFDPIEPSDLVFSMSGYLDASADTQWVRVEPFARTSDLSADPIDAEVALVLPDGSRQPMAQEVWTFVTGPAHLFWTVTDIVPGETYEVVARAADEAEARTTVRVPDDQAVSIDLVDGYANCPTLVAVRGAERLIDVQARYELRGPGREGERFRFSTLPSLDVTADGALRTRIYFGVDAEFMEISGLPGSYPVRSEVTVALGTDDWPDIEGLTLEEALRAANLGRVENGVGFVGGTVTKTFPFVPGFGFIPGIGDPRPPEPCVPAAGA